MQRDAPDALGVRPQDRIHHRGMVGVRRLQALAAHAGRRQRRFKRGRRFVRAGDDRLGRGVHHREAQPSPGDGRARQLFLDLRRRQGNGQHRPPRRVLHEKAPVGDQRQGVLEREDAGQAGGDVLADAVAEQGGRPDAPAHPKLGERIRDPEKRRLGRRRLVQPRDPLLRGGRREDEIAEVHAPGALQQVGASVQLGAEHRFAVVEDAPHVRVLRPLSGEQERDRPGGRFAGREEEALPGLQRSRGLVTVPANQRAPVLEGLAAAVQGVGRVIQVAFRALPEVGGEVARGGFERRGGARRQQQQGAGPWSAGRRGLWRLFEDHVAVGPSRAERRNARTKGPGRRAPGGQTRVDKERAVGEGDLRVRVFVMKARRQLPALQRQDSLDEGGAPGGLAEVPDVPFQGADRAEARFGGEAAVRLRERRHLNGVADDRARAVGFDVGDGLRIDAADGEGFGDRPGLPLHAGRQITDLAGAVVVDGRPLDDGEYPVAGLRRVGEPAQDDGARPAAEQRAAGLRVERAAMPVGGEDFSLFRHVSPWLGQHHGRAAGQRHVALAAQQALTGQVNRHQRGRAGRLHVEARAFEVQLVGEPRGQEVHVVARVAYEPFADRVHDPPVADEVVHHVRVHAARGEHADAARERLGLVAGVFQRLPPHLEEQAVLGVHHGRVEGRKAEEGGVEPVEALQHRLGFDVGGIAEEVRRFAGGQQLLVREELHRLDAVAQVAPELRQAARPGEASRRADDRDVVGR